MKTCSKCKNVKPALEFHNDLSRKDKLMHMCRSCAKEYSQAWRSKNRDKIVVTQAEYQQSKKGKFASYKSSTKARGLPFELTYSQFISFWRADYEYCGTTSSTVGVDRLDSSEGYFLANTVPCCTTCNIMKQSLSKTAFIRHIAKIFNFNKA